MFVPWVRGRQRPIYLVLYWSAQQRFEHFSSVLPEEMCLWAEQMSWGWGLAFF